ncbi:hypothetical protein Tco_0281829 [Tanacetum coccineum]
MITEILTRMYTRQQFQTQHPGLTHDDHKDDDQHEGEVNVEQFRETDIAKDDMESGLKLFSDVAVQILESKTAQNDKETSQELSTARNEEPHEDKAKVHYEFMGKGESSSVSQLGKWVYVGPRSNPNIDQITIRGSFLEDTEYSDRFKKKVVPEYKFEAPHGITQWPKAAHSMYKLRVGKPQRKRYVYSKNKTMNILSTQMEKRWGHNYVLIFVRLGDNLRYTITKSDF